MSGGRQTRANLEKAREESAARGARLAELQRAHQRLQHLYTVSKLLTRFQTVERTLPDVIAVLAQTIPLRSAIFILESAGAPRTIVWQATDEGADRLRTAKAHAQTSYRYLVRTGVDLEGAAGDTLGLPRLLEEERGENAGEPENFFMLPLAVGHASIFGALQIEGAQPLDEHDLVLFNAVVNQLAIALDRHAAISARQAIAETAEKEQRILADVSEVLFATLDYREALAALARFAVPRLADLCVVDELREDGTVECLNVVFADENKQPLAERTKGLGWGKAPVGVELGSGRPVLVSELTDALLEEIAVADPERAGILRAVGARSMMALPLVSRDKTLGALILVAAESGRRYSNHDLGLADLIARKAATAMDNARLYQQAQQATRAREDLLAIVSHDLKNPLGVILMTLAILMQGLKGKEGETLRKRLQNIQRSAVRMNRLIEDLLDTASIEAGRLAVEPRRLALAPLAADALEALQALAAGKSLELRSELAADLPAIRGDSSRIQQVLANLVGNAIKFTPEGGRITVRATRSGDAVMLSVTDTGPGIPPEEIPHLFDRFWQAKRTARLGTGLGLFIVKGIVEAHGGRVWVESRLGEGSTFFVTIPLAHEADQPADRARVNGSTSRIPDLLDAHEDEQAAELDELMRAVELRTRELHTAVESTRVARELAERANEFRRDFMSVVSHELRGPVTALELLLERLQRDRETPPTPRQDVLIRRMFAAVARLTAVIESLLQHALIQSGRLTTQIEVFHPRAVTEAVLEELRPYAEEKGLELRFFAKEGMPPLKSDPVLVRLILLNLIGNAIKFTERGLVEISLRSTDGVHCVVVKDSGPGIPAADRVRIFEPFVQMGDAKQKHVPGMGLGLALVREVAAALGGHVELDSQMGRGSTFTVTLPPAAEVPQEHGVPVH